MRIPSSLLTRWPAAGPSLMTDWAPLFVVLVVGVCVGVLAVAGALGLYDSWWAPLHPHAAAAAPVEAELSDAA